MHHREQQNSRCGCQTDARVASLDGAFLATTTTAWNADDCDGGGHPPDIAVVDVEREAHDAQQDAEASENRHRHEKLLGQEAELLDDHGLVRRGAQACGGTGGRWVTGSTAVRRTENGRRNVRERKKE